MQIEINEQVVFDSQWPVAEVRNALAAAKRIVVVAHKSADGDAVGSVVAMHTLLSRCTAAQVVPILPDGVPTDLSWIEGSSHVLCAKDNPEQCQRLVADADTLVCLDVSGLGRTGCMEQWLRQSAAKKLLIDHHIDPERECFTHVVSEPEASSTCELCYWLMRSAYGQQVFCKQSATALFAGMCTDTGTFAYSNRRTSLYLAAAQLLAYGIEPERITRTIRNNMSPQRMRFWGHAMDCLTEVYPTQSVALMVVRQSDMQAYDVQSEDLTGLINEVMRLRDTDCGILVREEAEGVRLSLRSKERYDVDQLAREMFGGGGHKRAAGATSHLTLAETLNTVKHKLLIALIPLLVVLATACGNVPVVEQTTAQPDSLQERLINANRYIAGSEQTQIENYIARRGWQMHQLVGGARVMETSAGNGTPVVPDEQLCITYSVEAINGKTIYSHIDDTVVAGRLQPNRGLGAALTTLHHGASATVVLPSEQGYGVAGDGNRIGSRMILIYHLKINN